MLLRPAWPSARQTFAQPLPIYEMGSQSTGNAAPCPTSAMRAQQMTTVRRARTLRREAVSSLRISLGQPASRLGKPRHSRILAITRRIHGQRDVPADHPELHTLLISVRQVLIDHLAHGAERGAGSAARYWARVEAVMLATIPVLRSVRLHIPTSGDASRAIRVRPPGPSRPDDARCHGSLAPRTFDRGPAVPSWIAAGHERCGW
jgi:hypothetical protein